MNKPLKRKCAILIPLLLQLGMSYSQDLSQKMDTLLNAYASQFRFSGVALVSKGGKILIEKGYGSKNFA